MPELTEGQWVILVTSIAGVVTTLFTQWLTWKREKRNREWDLADRAAARAERQQIERKVVEKIDENTAISRRAFHESNDFNRKLTAITDLFLRDRRDRQEDCDSKLEALAELYDEDGDTT